MKGYIKNSNEKKTHLLSDYSQIIKCKYINRSCTCYEEWCGSCSGVCCHWKAPAYDFTAPEIMIELSTGSSTLNETFNQPLIG